jgi:hypothetical protein
MKAPVTEPLAPFARDLSEAAPRAVEGFDAALRAVRDVRPEARPPAASRLAGHRDGAPQAASERPREEVARREDVRAAEGRGRASEDADRRAAAVERGDAAAEPRPRRAGRSGARAGEGAEDATAAAGVVVAGGGAMQGAGPGGPVSAGIVVGPSGMLAPGVAPVSAVRDAALLGLGEGAAPLGPVSGVRISATFTEGGGTTAAASVALHPELAGRVGRSSDGPRRPALAAWTGEVAERLLEAVADTAVRHGEVGLRALVDGRADSAGPVPGVGVAGGGVPLPPQEEAPVAFEVVLAGEPDASVSGEDPHAPEGLPWVPGPSVRSDGRARVDAGPATTVAAVGEAPELPEVAVRLPDRLHLGVVERGGAWQADIERHMLPAGVQGLDVLLRGDAAFVADVRGAQADMRRALEVQDARLLSFDVRADAGAGQGRDSRDPRGEGPGARADAGRPDTGRRVRVVAGPSPSAPRAGRIDRLA